MTLLKAQNDKKARTAAEKCDYKDLCQQDTVPQLVAFGLLLFFCSDFFP